MLIFIISLSSACTPAGAGQAGTAPLPFISGDRTATALPNQGKPRQTDRFKPTFTPSAAPTILASAVPATTEPSNTPKVLASATQQAGLISPRQPAATATPIQTLLALDPIQIRTPGNGSQVTSPIKIEVNFQLDLSDNLIRIELRRPDGVLLARKLLAGSSLITEDGLLSDQIEFEIAEPTGRAWLIVIVEPKRKIENQPLSPLAVNSSELWLSSTGPARLLPPAWQAKAIDIQQPASGASITGGVLSVSGLTRLAADQPLKVQLVDQNGKLIGQRLAGIQDTDQAGFKNFSTEIAYKIHQPIPAWVVVFRDDPQAGVVIHLASQPVLLNP